MCTYVRLPDEIRDNSLRSVTPQSRGWEVGPIVLRCQYYTDSMIVKIIVGRNSILSGNFPPRAKNTCAYYTSK